MFTPTSPPLIPLVLTVLFLLGGITLIWRGRRGRRVGTTPHCRRCEYPLVGIDSDRCPECGASLVAHNIATGRRVRSRGLVYAGAALVLVALAAGGLQSVAVYRGVDWYRFKPTGWVLRDLETGQGQQAGRAFDELFRRDSVGGLSPEHRRRLADVALAEQARATPSPLTAPMVNWLGNALLYHQLSDAQQDKFYDQFVRLNLTVRPTVALGDRIPYRVEFAGRGPSGGRWRYRVEHTATLLDGTGAKGGGGISGGSGVGSLGSSAGAFACNTPGRHEVTYTATVRVYHGHAPPDDDESAPPKHEREVALKGVTEVVPEPPAGQIAFVDDPKLAEQLRAAIVPAQFERSDDGRVSYVLKITSVPCDVAFDVFARAAGKEYKIDTLALRSGATTEYHLGGDGFHAPAVGEVDLVLRSNEKVARETVDLYRIWKGELVLPNVPVTDKRKK